MEAMEFSRGFESDRWARLRKAFDAVIAAKPEDRAAILEDMCGEDEPLRCEVEALVQASESTFSLLDHSQAPVPASAILEEERLSGSFGRYDIHRRIGAGGMGIVYEAQQVGTGRRVAVKVVRDFGQGDAFIKRHKREVATLARLNHPGIAILCEADEVVLPSGRTQPYLAMELVEGATLLEHAQAKNLSRVKRLKLLAEIADAVQHAHDHGVLHCDLKPSNVMVTDEGRPKVLDFGVARLLDDAQLSRTTRYAAVAGTLEYMSPEQSLGDTSEISVRVDIYSLGVLAYELLSGRLPFEFGSKAASRSRANPAERPITPLGEWDRALRGEVQDVIHKAMAPQAGDRYDSARAFADDLRRLAAGEPPVGPRTRRVRRAWHAVKKHRSAVAAALIVSASLLAATIVSVQESARALDAQRRSERNVASLWAFAKQVLFDMHDGIASLPGSTPVRRELIEAARANLEQIRADAGDDPAFLLDLALAYERLGDVLGNTKMFNLGDVDAARASYDTALSLLERLAARYPQDIAIAHAYARLHIRRAETAGPGEGAAEDPGLIPHLVRGVDLLRSVVRHSDLPEARLDLVHALIIDGLERQCEGDVEAMLERGREAMRLAEQLCEARPGDTSILLERHTTASWYGEMLLLADRPREAVESLAPAADWLRHHGQAHTDDPRIGYQRILIGSRLAIARQKAGEVERGLGEGAEVISFAAFLASANPNDQRIVRSHEVCVVWLAGAHLEVGDDANRSSEERREHYAQGAALFREAIALLAARQARGWVPHWESGYPEEYATGLRRCEEGFDSLSSH